MIWVNKCAPKMSTCALLAILNKLNTKDKISGCNSSTDLAFVLSSNNHEERDHLFFTCQYSKALWDIIKRKLNTNDTKCYGIN